MTMDITPVNEGEAQRITITISRAYGLIAGKLQSQIKKVGGGWPENRDRHRHRLSSSQFFYSKKAINTHPRHTQNTHRSAYKPHRARFAVDATS